ncbi:MAG: vWA domain-containing protein, partial [Candidatus Micrarchaeota archaeon]
MKSESKLALAIFGLLFLFAPLVIAVDPYVSFVKTASPSSVPMGDNVTITINATGKGSPLVNTIPVDVMLVVDRSGSMTWYSDQLNYTNGTITTSSVWVMVQSFTLPSPSDFDVVIISYSGVSYQFKIQRPDGSDSTFSGSSESRQSFSSGPAGTYLVWIRKTENGDMFYHVTSQKPPARIDATKTSAKAFVDVLDETAKAGLVSFSSSATTNKQLALMTTLNKNALKDSIDTLSASGSTNTGDGIKKATTELTSTRARLDAIKFMVLMSDG